MVQFKPTSALFAVAALIAKNVVAEEAHALEVFPELKGTGPIDIAYTDPETHKVVVEHIDEHGESALEKRTYYMNQDAIAKLLRKHNGYGFCNGFCPEYQPKKPVTETSLKTFTKFVTITTSVVPAPTTITLTATGDAPADSTVLQTTTVSETAKQTLTDAPVTVSNVQTITITSAATTVVTQSTTLSFPSAPAPTFKARHVSPPWWLNGVAKNLICPACTKVWSAPPAKTVSVCKTTTVTSTRTQTATAAVVTATSTVSVTPTAKTVTQVIATTFTVTDLTTVTPTITTTSTTTAIAFTTVTSTTTETLCPQQTAGVDGISAMAPGTLKDGGDTQSPSECCLACFNDPQGCGQWAYFSRGTCYYSVPGTGSGTPSAQCPNGKVNGMLFTGSGPGSGGPGLCAP